MTIAQDKLGFYQVGDFKSYSKFEAIEQHVRTAQPFHWNFNDAVFESVDWSVEPTESLAELYRQRAQQLRDQYDYIVLWFSGGADSSNILNTFVNNDICLDECASYVNYDATQDSMNFLNAEIGAVAQPKIEQARQKQPGLLHTILDITDTTIKDFGSADMKFDWIYHCNHFSNPNNISKYRLKYNVKHWQKLIDAGKKICWLYGKEKPSMRQVGDKYYFVFTDLIDAPAREQINEKWEFNESFYWTPDFTKLVVKQAHVVKRLCKNLQPEDIVESGDLSGSMVYVNVARQIKRVTLNRLNREIYPGWYPVPYQFKPGSIIYTPRDTWFFNLPDSDPAKFAWQLGINHRWQTTPDSFKIDTRDQSKGFKVSSSQPYFVGT